MASATVTPATAIAICAQPPRVSKCTLLATFLHSLTSTLAGLPDLVPLQVAAQEFGVSRTTLYNYVRLGRLKRYRKAMDRRTFLDRAQLRRLTRARTLD